MTKKIPEATEKFLNDLRDLILKHLDKVDNVSMVGALEVSKHLITKARLSD